MIVNNVKLQIGIKVLKFLVGSIRSFVRYNRTHYFRTNSKDFYWLFVRTSKWNVVNQVRKRLAIEHTCHFMAPGRRFRYIALIIACVVAPRWSRANGCRPRIDLFVLNGARADDGWSIKAHTSWQAWKLDPSTGDGVTLCTLQHH